MLQEVQTLVHLITYFFDSRGFVAKYLLDIIFTVKKNQTVTNKKNPKQLYSVLSSLFFC